MMWDKMMLVSAMILSVMILSTSKFFATLGLTYLNAAGVAIAVPRTPAERGHGKNTSP